MRRDEMATYFRRCQNDEELAKISLFILNNRHDLHPSYSTLDMVALLYSYITEGILVYTVDDQNKVLGASAYYLGTREHNFEDRHIAYVDIVIVDKTERGTRVFIQGLIYLIDHISHTHPDVEEIQFSALSDNKYICKLYGKFAKASYTRDGAIGEETVFSEKISILKHQLKRFQR
jgi:hypothetical protein